MEGIEYVIWWCNIGVFRICYVFTIGYTIMLLILEWMKVLGECKESIEEVVKMVEEGRESVLNVVCVFISTLSK